MRLADFILANIEPILVEWESFARSIWPGNGQADPAELRDHAEAILHGTVGDMQSEQTAQQREAKSRGRGDAAADESRINLASESHGAGRAGSGFDMESVVAEYRALRASVLRLWRDSKPHRDENDLDDITRFNESIDQSLAYAVRSYLRELEREKEVMLTSEQAARVEAESANRAKDLFLATLSHEMRTPLNSIVGWLSILRSGDCSKEDLVEGLDVIEHSTRSQVQLIDDILDVSRIVSGKLRVNPRPCALAEIIEAGIDTVRPAAEARQITLDVDLDPTLNHATCDATRIQQVVWNLLSNAVKFTPKRGRIDVRLSRHDSNMQLRVTDTGQGIAPDLLPYVFDRFRQADSSTRRRFSGLGLGLSIVKHIIEQHGGTIEATSPGIGKGSTFIVQLPIRAVQTTPPHLPAAPNASEASDSADSAQSTESAADTDTPLPADRSLAGKNVVRLDGVRVLVVDDEAYARRLLVKVLEHAGATVVAAGSAAEAMEMLPKFEPTVLVSDIGMPGEDGLDLIRQVRGGGFDAADLPAVALTAFVQKGDAKQALDAGFQVHVSKPVDLPELTAVIARLTGRES